MYMCTCCFYKRVHEILNQTNFKHQSQVIASAYSSLREREREREREHSAKTGYHSGYGSALTGYHSAITGYGPGQFAC